VKERDFVFPKPSEKIKKCSSLLFFSWHSGSLCSINQGNSLAASEGHQALLLPCVAPSCWLQRDRGKNNPGVQKQEDNTGSYFANSVCLSCTRPCISSAGSGQMKPDVIIKTKCGSVWFLGFFFVFMDSRIHNKTCLLL